jgi:hypothetical protein
MISGMEGERENLDSLSARRVVGCKERLGRRDFFRAALAGAIAASTTPPPAAEEDKSPREREIIEAYKPSVEGNIDDLTVNARNMLLAIPSVVSVERFPAREGLTRRIVHLLDWHWISREDFVHEQEVVETIRGLEEDFIEDREAAIVGRMEDGGILVLGGGHDLSNNVPSGCEYLRVETKAYWESGRSAEGAGTEEERRARYEAFLREVEAVQADQRIILWCLARRHGVRHIYQAGPHVLLRSLFREQVQAVREYGDDPLFRETRLKIGVAGQLLACGILEEVRAADDFSLMFLEGTKRRS